MEVFIENKLALFTKRCHKGNEANHLETSETMKRTTIFFATLLAVASLPLFVSASKAAGPLIVLPRPPNPNPDDGGLPIILPRPPHLVSLT